jgi:P4 family phage/plasmid primase-like protien
MAGNKEKHFKSKKGSTSEKNANINRAKSNIKISPHIIQKMSAKTTSRSATDLLYKYLNQYKRSSTDKRKYTHTSIPDATNDIYGGSYIIPDDKMPDFWKKYSKAINKGAISTLTEAQLDNGPILVDLDERYDLSILTDIKKERQHNSEIIQDTLESYLEAIKELINLDNGIITKEKAKCPLKLNKWCETDIKKGVYYLPVFIFERTGPTFKKNEITDKNGKTETNWIMKDGIHMVIGISLERKYQKILRELVMTKLEEYGVFTSIRCSNKISDIVDNAIASGGTNWQVYCSRKPNNEPYKLTHVFNITNKNGEWEIIRDSENFKKFSDKKNLNKLLPIISARNNNFLQFPINDGVDEKYQNMMGKKKSSSQISLTNNVYNPFNILNLDFDSKESLEEFMDNNILCDGNNIGSEIKDIHRYTMLLDENFYDPEPEWMKVAWALRNTHKILFYSWILFSCKSHKFDNINFRQSMYDLYEIWEKMNTDNDNKLTHASIRYWAKQCNPEEYNKIYCATTEYIIRSTINEQTNIGSDYDIAKLTKHLVGDVYACVNIKKNLWYTFNGNLWKVNDEGISLRSILSNSVHNTYLDYVDKCVKLISDIDTSNEEQERMSKKIQSEIRNALLIANKLKQSSRKSQIMTELKELYHNSELITKLDDNDYLLGFNNGVYDFKKNKFRKGEPSDYISMSTGYDYIEIDPENEKHSRIMDEINDFMSKLFPNEELRQYMWEHLASSLIGENKAQKFNVYIGGGSNGKSKLIDLMKYALGDYYGTVDIANFTTKRQGGSGPKPELVEIRNKRYVNMSEPSKGDRLNDGLMKQWTGGDIIQARGMYELKTLSFVPKFTLTLQTNALLDINANDNGIWRRMRVVKFETTFKDILDEISKLKKNSYQFLKDRSLNTKLKLWGPYFMCMLIKIANAKQGDVDDCNYVMDAVNRYKENQDLFLKFCNSKIVFGEESDNIRPSEIIEVFKIWYAGEYPNEKVPRPKELRDYLQEKYGELVKRKWWGIKIVYDDLYDSDEN